MTKIFNLCRQPGCKRSRRVRRLQIQPLEDRVVPTVGDLLHTLTPPGGTGSFGWSVAISSDYVAVGSIGDTVDSVSNAGAVHLYDANTGDFVRTIPNPDPQSGDEFGYAVAVSGDLVLVGAPTDNSDGAHIGGAYLFQASTGDLLWTLHNPTPELINPSYFEWYGCSVGLTSGGVALVGAYLEDTTALYAGAVYKFSTSDGSPLGQLVAPEPEGGDDFGFSIAVGCGRVAIGAATDEVSPGPKDSSGGVHLYDEATLTYERSIYNPTPHPLDFFGCSVGLSGTNLVVGAYNGDAGSTADAGSAYVFDAATGDLVQTLTSPTPTANDRYGAAVAVSGDTVIVGAPQDAHEGTGTGAGFIYDAPSGVKLATLLNPVASGTSKFGSAVAADGARLAVGASSTGNAYIYEGRITSSPPTANDDSFNVPENASATTLDVLANDTADDPSLLAVTDVTQPTHGSVTIAVDGKSVQYTPSSNYIGPDAFTYTAADPNGSSTATVSIMDEGPPQPQDDSFNVPENSSATTLDVLSNDIAVEPSLLTVSAVTQPSHGTVTISVDNKSVQYTPDPFFNGPDSFTYTAHDAFGSVDATVNMTVDLVNNSPQAGDDEATVDQDSGANEIDVLANDSDPDFGQTVSVTQVTQGHHGTAAISGSGTGLTYTPNNGYVGPDSFTYTISDGNGGTATASVVVSVQQTGSVNNPPDALNDQATLTEDGGAQTIDALLNDTDPDSGDSLTITTVTQGQHGTVTIAADGKSLTYSPSANFAGQDSFVYAISDGRGGSDFASVDVMVNNDVSDRLEIVTSPGIMTFTEGDAPVTVDGALRVSPNNGGIKKVQVKITSGYVKGRDFLLFTPIKGLRGSFNRASGTLTLTGKPLTLNPEAILREVIYKNASPDPVAGIRTLSFTAFDALGAGDPAYRQIDVVAINTPPAIVVSGPTLTYKENAPAVTVAPRVKITDLDNTLAGGARVAITGNFAAGEDVLSVKLTPGITGTYDAGSGVLDLSGTATLTTYAKVLRSVKYSNMSNAPSTDLRTISFTVTDGLLPSAAATRTVTVVAVNDAPAIHASGHRSLPDVSMGDQNPSGDTIAELLGTSVSDPDAGALGGIAITALTGTTNGTWQYSMDDGATWQPIAGVSPLRGLLLRDTDRIRFVPQAGFTGQATISYHAWDQTTGTVGQLARLGVGGLSRAFSVANETATVNVV